MPGRRVSEVAQALLPLPEGLMRGTRFLPRDCSACGGRAVPGEGSANPAAFVVGEAPGPKEEALGRPFVGRAGKILRVGLREAGWSPAAVWITNVVKCFPFNLEGGRKRIRKPTPQEVRACLPHLGKEIRSLRPQLLVALGRTATEALTGRRVAQLGALRGTLLDARVELPRVPVFVTIHPSALHYGKLRGQHEGFVTDLRTARGRVHEGAEGP